MNFTLLSALVLLIIFISTLIRSTFGFGNALIAMPLLVLILGTKTAAPLVALVGIVIALVMLLREWQEVDFKAAFYLILSTLAGIPLGLFFLKSTPEHIVKMILGLVLIGFGLYNLSGLRLPSLKRGYLVFPFGLLAGILGGAYNANGPPVVIYGVMRGWGKEKFRATLQGYFLISSALIVVGHGISGLWTRSVLVYFLASIPIVVFAVLLGDWMVQKISGEHFNRAINLFMVAAGFLMFI